MSSRLRVAVVGATGYAGAELVRILLHHPSVQLATVVSRSRSGELTVALGPALWNLFSWDASHVPSREII